MKKHRPWLFLFVGVLLLVIVDRVYVFNISSYANYEDCQHSEKNKNNQYCTKSPLVAIIVKLEGLLETHEKLFIVLSTIAIAWFTGTLWRSTTGLERMAKQQAIDMRESLAIAEASAETSKRMVDSMEDTAKKELRAYLSVQKASLRVRRLAIGIKILGEILIVNSGKTIAHNAQLAIHIEMRDSMTGIFDIQFRPGSTYLTPGSYWNAQQVNEDMILTESFLTKELATKNKYAILWGKISYEDAFKEQRESTFRFRQGMMIHDDNGFINHWDVYPCEEGNAAT